MSAAAGEGSQTLERGIAALVELSRHPSGLTTSQVATRCDLHRSIANRLLVSLVRTGFAVRDDRATSLSALPPPTWQGGGRGCATSPSQCSFGSPARSTRPPAWLRS
jgi:hypothetical protein